MSLPVGGPVRASSDGPTLEAELECLALAIYFESRSEPDLGKLAVGHVIINRMRDERYPGTICDVVKQGGEAVRYRCQFSFWCDGKSDEPENAEAWRRAVAFGRAVYWGYSQDPTEGALSYHADYVQPGWASAWVKGPKIGRHIFYRAEDGIRYAVDHNLIRPGIQTAENAQSN